MERVDRYSQSEMLLLWCGSLRPHFLNFTNAGPKQLSNTYIYLCCVPTMKLESE